MPIELTIFATCTQWHDTSVNKELLLALCIILNDVYVL